VPHWKRRRQRLGSQPCAAKRLRAERPTMSGPWTSGSTPPATAACWKLRHIVDEYTPEALAMRVARSIDGGHAPWVLDQIVRVTEGAQHNRPRLSSARTDNRVPVTHAMAPGSPHTKS
jgi:hypothetical protein